MKRFRGWEPVTHYEYRGGRVAASWPDIEWDDQERAWMLALQSFEDSRCPGCGGNLAVTTAPENEDKYRPEAPLQCFRCVGFARSHEAHKDNPHPLSLIHLVPQAPGKVIAVASSPA